MAAILGQAVNRSEPDPRDLTDWLYREMIDNAKDPTVRRLKAMNWLAGHLADAVICDVAQAIAMADWSDIPVGLMMSYALVANRDPAIAATVLHGVALYEYSQLVKDGAIYDFLYRTKHSFYTRAQSKMSVFGTARPVSAPKSFGNRPHRAIISLS